MQLAKVLAPIENAPEEAVDIGVELIDGHVG